jgi:PERQ amino acid-rich with GYF domain-containing protein
MPRKPSLSTLQVPGVLSPTSPRTRVGYTSNFDGVLNNGESWMARRRFSEASLKVSNSSTIQTEDSASKPEGIAEVKEEDSATAVHVCKEEGTFLSPASAAINSAIPTSHSEISVTKDTAENITGPASLPTYRDYQEIGQSPVILDLAAVEWSYKDPTGQVQGKNSLLVRNSVVI